MKFRDIKIGTRLTLGFGVILMLVSIMAGVAFVQSNKLWKSTDDLYSHPLQVARATRDFRSDILEMRHSLRDMVQAENQEAIRSSILKFNMYETDITRCFDITYSKYLGDKSDIDSVNYAYTDWLIYCKEIISLVQNGQQSSAAERIKPAGPGDIETENMIILVQKMISFATRKADAFYTDAAKEKRALDNRLVIVIILVFLFSMLAVYVISKGIRGPILSLTKVADEFSLRKYHVRSSYDSANEIGTLAKTFNSMAISVQSEVEIRENVAWVSQNLMEHNELRPFCQTLLSVLLEKTGSQIAAVYLLNKENKMFEHFESVGMSAADIKSFRADTKEGEFGSVLTSKKIVRVSDIPDDTVYKFNVVSGNFRPKEIVTIPILDSNEVMAIISISSLKNYSPLSIRLINDIGVTLTARMLGVFNYQKITDYSALLDSQNKELDQKTKEMMMQADELREYNIELELQKKQLDEANKLKSSFLSNMSHELRTPLNSIIALSGVLGRRLNGKIPADELNYLGIIERNGKNLLLLINDILDLSRIESGREEMTYSQFSVRDVVKDILNMLEPIIMEKGISADCLLGSDIPDIISDKNKCHHILQNIISNAVKFTEKGSVGISAVVNSENIAISVKDSGIGVSEDFLPFIFDEFRQADDKASRKFGGTGLGLAIAKKYCDMLDGNIEVKSQTGVGSTFKLILPLKPSGGQLDYSDPEMQKEDHKEFSFSPNNSNPGTGKTLLLVEDSEPQIIQITDVLREEGYILQVARNGREALEIIKLQVPDAMILDLQMPEVDGFEVLREIRNLKETRSIPVLILTAKHVTKSELSFLKGNHIYQLIQKGGLNRNDLLEHVKNLMMPPLKENPALQEIKNGPFIEGKKSNILVIEDNPDNQITLKVLLEENHKISFAADGFEGLEKAKALSPDLILLDISLPGMDGFRVLDELKKDDKLSLIKVIALTARAMKGDREALLSYGFDGYIAKPVDNETFENTIRDYLNFSNPKSANKG
jgi:signal transduction histidine kinase/CheY-like chemotaxis protein/CHASE3 domain sensor protein